MRTPEIGRSDQPNGESPEAAAERYHGGLPIGLQSHSSMGKARRRVPGELRVDPAYWFRRCPVSPSCPDPCTPQSSRDAFLQVSADLLSVRGHDMDFVARLDEI